jgi:hypothetical protein
MDRRYVVGVLVVVVLEWCLGMNEEKKGGWPDAGTEFCLPATGRKGHTGIARTLSILHPTGYSLLRSKALSKSFRSMCRVTSGRQ